MTDEKTAQQTGVFGFLKLLAEASVILGAGLFLAGWSYLYGYYRAFGLSADTIDLPIDSFLIHSIPVVDSIRLWTGSIVFWGVIGFSTLIFVAAFMLRNNTQMRLLFEWSYPMIVVILLAIAGVKLSRYATGVGQYNASRDVRLSTTTLPYIQLEGADDKKATGCSMTESNYRLLIHAGGRVYVVLPIDSENSLPGNVRVCSFSDTRINVMRMQVGLSESR
jgi:uncharacterized integral membrane protein